MTATGRTRSGSPAPTFRMGSDAHYPEEAPAATSRSTGSGSTATRSPTARFAAFVARDRLRDRRRAPARPRRLPGRAGGEPRARLAGLHAHARAGRPAPHQPVVGVDAGRVLAAPRGPGLGARRARGPPGRARRLRGRRAPTPTWAGRGAADRGASGSSPRAAGSTAPPTSGATSPSRAGERLANYWHGDFPWRAEPGYGDDRAGRLVRRPTATGCSTWPATSGSGRPTGTAAARRRASTRPSRSSRSRARCVKGGSFLCADSYCLRYRPAARRPQMIDTGMSHIGFRCVRQACP